MNFDNVRERMRTFANTIHSLGRAGQYKSIRGDMHIAKNKILIFPQKHIHSKEANNI